jgi:hypothetical protein
MKTLQRVRTRTLLATMLGAFLLAVPSAAQTPPSAAAALPSETPAQFAPTTYGFDYDRHNTMILCAME